MDSYTYGLYSLLSLTVSVHSASDLTCKVVGTDILGPDLRTALREVQ